MKMKLGFNFNREGFWLTVKTQDMDLKYTLWLYIGKTSVEGINGRLYNLIIGPFRLNLQVVDK